MENYFLGEMKVQMHGGGKKIWQIRKGEVIKSPDTMAAVTKVENMRLPYTHYVIETLFRTFKVDCVPGCLVMTDYGPKAIGKLKEGDGIYVMGAFIPKRLTMIKKIRKEKQDEAMLYKMHTSGQFYMEGILFKSQNP